MQLAWLRLAEPDNVFGDRPEEPVFWAWAILTPIRLLVCSAVRAGPGVMKGPPVVRSVYCLSFKRNIILWGGFVWWPVSPAGHARSCADTLLRPCVYADMGWWAHAYMRWWASRLVGSCAGGLRLIVGYAAWAGWARWASGLMGWWATCRWWASLIVGNGLPLCGLYGRGL